MYLQRKNEIVASVAPKIACDCLNDIGFDSLRDGPEATAPRRGWNPSSRPEGFEPPRVSNFLVMPDNGKFVVLIHPRLSDDPECSVLAGRRVQPFLSPDGHAGIPSVAADSMEGKKA